MIHEIKLSDFIERMRTLGGDVEAAIVRGIQSAAMRLHGFIVHEIDNASPHPAVDRADLRNSVETVTTDKGAKVRVTAPHAPYIEDGTRPFWPPFQPIYEWVLRKQIATDPAEAKDITRRIQVAISKRGIEPRHFMAKAFGRFTAGKYVGREVGAELELLAQARAKGRVGDQRRGSGLKEKGP